MAWLMNLSEALVEAPIEYLVLVFVVSLCDRLPTCHVRRLISDNFAVTALKSAKDCFWCPCSVAEKEETD